MVTYDFYNYPSFSSSNSSAKPSTSKSISSGEYSSTTTAKKGVENYELVKTFQERLGTKNIAVGYDPTTNTTTIINNDAPQGYRELGFQGYDQRQLTLDPNVTKQLQAAAEGKTLLQYDIITPAQSTIQTESKGQVPFEIVRPEAKAISNSPTDYKIEQGFFTPIIERAKKEIGIKEGIRDMPIAQSEAFFEKQRLKQVFNESFPKGTNYYYDSEAKAAVAVVPGLNFGGLKSEGKIIIKNLETLKFQEETDFERFPNPNPTPDKSSYYDVPKKEYLPEKISRYMATSYGAGLGESGSKVGVISGTVGGLADIGAEAGKTFSSKKGELQFEPKYFATAGIAAGLAVVGGYEQGLKLVTGKTAGAEYYTKTGNIIPYASEIAAYGLGTAVTVGILKGGFKIAKAPVKLIKQTQPLNLTARTQQVGRKYLSVAEGDLGQGKRIQIVTEAEAKIVPVNREISGLLIGDTSRISKVGSLDRSYFYKIEPKEVGQLKGTQVIKLIETKSGKILAEESKPFQTDYLIEKGYSYNVPKYISESLMTKTFEIGGRKIITFPERIMMVSPETFGVIKKSKLTQDYFFRHELLAEGGRFTPTYSTLNLPKPSESKISVIRGLMSEGKGQAQSFASYINKQINLGMGKANIESEIRPIGASTGLFGATRSKLYNLFAKKTRIKEFLEHTGTETTEGKSVLEGNPFEQKQEAITEYIKVTPSISAKVINELSLGRIPISNYVEVAKGSGLLNAASASGGYLSTQKTTPRLVQTFSSDFDVIRNRNEQNVALKNYGFTKLSEGQEITQKYAPKTDLINKTVSRYEPKFKSDITTKFEDKLNSKYGKETLNKFENKVESGLKLSSQSQFAQKFENKFENRFANKFENRFANKFASKFTNKFENPYSQKYQYQNPYINNYVPGEFIPKIPKIPRITITDKKNNGQSESYLAKSSILTEGFDVFARRKGKYVKISKKSLSKEAAYEYGARFADTTSAATFKARPSGTLIERKPEFANLGILGKFRSKQEKGEQIFIERRKFRLDVGSERGELRTAKAIKNNYKWF